MVVFAPISKDADWRLSLEERARAQDWQVFHAWGEHEVALLDAHRDVIFLANDFDAEVRFCPTHIVCLVEDPRVVDRHFRERLGYGEHSLWRTTTWYAEALSSRSASISFSRIDLDSKIYFPGLGIVSLAQDAKPVEALEPDLSGALSMFDDLSQPRAMAATWSLDYFAKPGGDDTSGWFELFGPRRILVAGPYFWLPKGIWRARMEILIDTEGFDASLRVEWGLSDHHSMLESVIRKSGRYEIVMDYTWDAPAAADFRILINRAAFGGRVHLSDCEVAPVLLENGDQAVGMLESRASLKV